MDCFEHEKKSHKFYKTAKLSAQKFDIMRNANLS